VSIRPAQKTDNGQSERVTTMPALVYSIPFFSIGEQEKGLQR